jgi:peptidoglycan hydrolase-like protein with peptidoglycan-binding domain
VSRSGRNPFLALVTAEAAAAPRPTDLPADLPAGPGRRVLARGATGEDVRDLQTRLAADGADVIADGSYGPRTVAAVTAFQARRRLAVDGITGPQTWAALSTP